MDIVLKRVMAYIIDILLISIVVTPLLNWKVLNPYIDEYTKYYEEYTKLVEDANAGDVDTETDEYKDKIIELNYQISENKVISSSISAVSMLLYFGVIQFILKGQTVGKKIMKIRVVANNENKKLNVGHYLLRSVVLNNIVFSIILIVGVYITKAPAYYTLSMVVSYLQLVVMAAIMLMVVLRKDFRGLHDVIAQTKVVDLAVPVADGNKQSEVIEEMVTIETKEVEEKKNKEDTNNKNTRRKKTTNKSKSSRRKE